MVNLTEYRYVRQCDSLLQAGGAGRVLDEGQAVGSDLRVGFTAVVQLLLVIPFVSGAEKFCLRSERNALQHLIGKTLIDQNRLGAEIGCDTRQA